MKSVGIIQLFQLFQLLLLLLLVYPYDTHLQCLNENKRVINMEKDNRLIQKALESFQNRHILFIGDSLTRFHYFAFIYALKYRKFMDADMKPNPTVRHEYSSDYDFYLETNEVFRPNSHCDCYRSEISYHQGQVENRYYYDLQYKINVTYFIYYGHDEIQGHWLDNLDSDEFRTPRKACLNLFWHTRILDFFKRIAPRLTPTPNALIFNVGIHVTKEENWQKYSYLKEVAETGLKVIPHFIFRTTTYSKLDRTDVFNKSLPFQHYSRDSTMCELPNIHCLNFSWTRCLLDEDYIDDFHYKIDTYNRMARQSFSYLIRLYYNISLSEH